MTDIEYRFISIHMIVLGIETSCDETAAAIVTDTREIRSNVVLSQLEEHAIFGGVVPEVAARAHVEHIDTVIKLALEKANLTINDIDAVAATCGPGLIGGVMIGMMSAKAIASARKIPFIAINHLEGHLLTPRLVEDIRFPYLALLVSGGHTQILVAEKVGQYKRWGTTLDDAAGECFDKSAKLMGLPHPGGPNVEKSATLCTNHEKALERFALPTPLEHRKNCDFSFSGLKTAIRTHVQKLPPGELDPADVSELCYALEQKMAKILAIKSAQAIKRFKQEYPTVHQPSFIVCGGVSANKTIRTKLETLVQQEHMVFNAPPLSLTGDNGAMIAWAGIERLKHGQADKMDTPARPRWPLDPTAEPRHGAGVKA